MATHQVAIITGAASGIGLGLTKHLHAKGWRIVMADLDVEGGERLARELGDSVIFQETNVADWDSNGALFKRAWEWAGCIDFFAANAGIGETGSVFDIFPADEDPQKPDLATLKVDFISVLYGLRWFVHYARKNKKPGGKVVVTASCAGLYGFPPAPQYCAAKHAVRYPSSHKDGTLMTVYSSLAWSERRAKDSQQKASLSTQYVQPWSIQELYQRG